MLSKDIEYIFNSKVGETPFSFISGGPYPETDIIKGGARDPFVIVLNSFDLDWKPEDYLPSGEALKYVKSQGRAVECLFSFFD